MEKSARPGVNRLAEGQGHCSWPAPAPSPVCGEPGKGRALVLPALFWPGASLPRATRSTAPGTVLYISWGGSVLGFRLPCCTGPWGAPAGEAPSPLHRLCKQEIHKQLRSPFRERSRTGHSSPFTHCSANPKYHPHDGTAAMATLPQ